jgi:hypothetical protein
VTAAIEPALSAEEWRVSSAAVAPMYALQELSDLTRNHLNEHVDLAQRDVPKAIALANAALPDSDPRKITPLRVAWLRDAVAHDLKLAYPNSVVSKQVEAFANLLASYLPPEGT